MAVFVDKGQGLSVALGSHSPLVLVLDFVAAVAQLPQEHEDGLEDIGGLEAGDHAGDVIVVGEELIGL
ncbi:hypothetical protein ES705_43362 [subsurface metagenome]